MTAHQAIRVRTWIRASDADVRDGLLGWISVEFGPLLIDVTLRRLASGRLGLSFPSRTSKSGMKHPVVRPVDDAARRAVEAVILGQLGQHTTATGQEDGDA